jgi:hypothetical protein
MPANTVMPKTFSRASATKSRQLAAPISTPQSFFIFATLWHCLYNNVENLYKNRVAALEIIRPVQSSSECPCVLSNLSLSPSLSRAFYSHSLSLPILSCRRTGNLISSRPTRLTHKSARGLPLALFLLCPSPLDPTREARANKLLHWP